MPEKRIQKRKRQYAGYIADLAKLIDSEAYRKTITDLGKLMEDMEKYMDPDNPLPVDRATLNSFLQRYLGISDRLADFFPKEDNSSDDGWKKIDEFEKMRKVIGKDIRIINSALKNKNIKEFSLIDIFEQSRSITVQIDPDKVEKAGAHLNTRLHIQTMYGDKAVDGFFTIHQKPFNYAVEKENLVKDVAGDDDLVRSFVYYLLEQKGKKLSKLAVEYISNQSERFARDLPSTNDAIAISVRYKDEQSYLRAFQNALKADFQNYTTTNGYFKGSSEYETLRKFVNNIADKKGIDKLVDSCNQGFELENKASIHSTLGTSRVANMDKRNSAMSSVAELLGMSYILAPSTNMHVKMGDETLKGTFMQKAEGVDPGRPWEHPELFKLSPDSFKTVNFFKDAANIQILDYICGNIDRHTNNMFFILKEEVDRHGDKKVVVDGIRGIDNDTSFGAIDLSKNPRVMSFVDLKDIHIIPAKTAENIMKIRPEMLRSILTGFGLRPIEIEKAVGRLNDVRNVILASRNDYKYIGDTTINVKKDGSPMIKIVDDDELKKLNPAKELYRPIDRTNKKDKTTLNFYTRWVQASVYGTIYANMQDETYRAVEKQLCKIREQEPASEKILEDFESYDNTAKTDPKIKNYMKTKEYKDMKASMKMLREELQNFSGSLTPETIMDLFGKAEVRFKAAEDAVLKTTNYFLAIQEKIEKAESEGKPVSDEQREYVQKVRDTLDEIEETYAQFSKFATFAKRQSDLMEDRNRDFQTKKAEAQNQMHAPEEPELSYSIERLERTLETDKAINTECINLLLDGAIKGSKSGILTIVETIRIDTREAYIKLAKNAVGDINLNDEEKRELKERVAANKVLTRLFSDKNAAAKLFLKHPEGINEMRNEIINIKRQNPKWQEGLDYIEENVLGYAQCLELKGEGLTAEQQNLISRTNHLMTNSEGNKGDESSFYKTYLYFSDKESVDLVNSYKKVNEKLTKMDSAIKKENKQKESKKQEPQKNEIKKSDTQTKKVEGKAINKK